MVLTRSNRNSQVSEGRVHDTVLSMENGTRTTAPSASVSNPTMVTTSTATIAPAVQQFMTLVHDRTGFSNESRMSHNSITSPEYSSITARNVQQEFRQNVATAPAPPTGSNNPALGADMFAFMREEFARQISELRNTMQQEIARAGSQATGSPLNPQQAALTASLVFLNPQPPPPGTQQNVSNLYNIQTQQNLPAPSSQQQNQYTYQPVHPVLPPQPMPPQAPVITAQSSPAASLPPEFTFTSPRKIDLSKWGIKFDGTTKSMSVEDLIFRVDVLRKDYNCSFNDIRRSFHLLLEGQALDWYWNMRKLTPIQTWEDLETEFLTQYRRSESEFQLQKKIMDRCQLPQESFEDFYNAVMRLRNQQRTPYTEKDLIEIMKSNLKPSLSHLLFSVKIDGLHEFCQQAKRAENLLSSQRQRSSDRGSQIRSGLPWMGRFGAPVGRMICPGVTAAD